MAVSVEYAHSLYPSPIFPRYLLAKGLALSAPTGFAMLLAGHGVARLMETAESRALKSS